MNPFDPSHHDLGTHQQIQSDWDFAQLASHFGSTLSPAHGEHDAIIGTPGDASSWVHQTTPFTCDVVSQQMILREFGVNTSEAQLTYEATAHGWLTDRGTTPQDMAQLLELHGVHTHSEYNGSLDSLTSELAQGHKVIVAVDSNELWHSNSPLVELFHSPRPDHAIVVTGLNMSDPSHPKVFVNDPGDPNGAGKSYALDQFLEAWSASGNTYVATDSAPPHLADDAVLGTNYDPTLGMYMDQGFWVSFLKGLAFAATDYAITHHDSVWPSSHQGDAALNPWEHMNEAQRNDLLVKI